MTRDRLLLAFFIGLGSLVLAFLAALVVMFWRVALGVA